MDTKITNKTGPQVMVVEDDRIVAAMVEHLLTRQGFVVQPFGDGRSAAAAIEAANAPDLVLLDVMLPFIDGFELIEKIRSRVGWEAVKIIMLTSKTQERNVVRALEAGADDYIVKPFLPQELVARVKRFTPAISLSS